MALMHTRQDTTDGAAPGSGRPRAGGRRSWLGLVGVLVAAGVAVGIRPSTRVEVHRFDAAGLRSVDVATGAGRVQVTAGAVDQVEVRAVVRTNRRAAAVTAEVAGDTVVVRQTCTRGWGRCSVGFEITVPGQFATVARTANGEIRVDGLGGDADLRTSNGAISGAGLGGSHVRAATSNGAVRLVFAAAPLAVEATTANGGITLALPRDGTSYRIDAGSRNGNVDSQVEADPASPRSVVARAGNGGVRILRGATGHEG